MDINPLMRQTMAYSGLVSVNSDSGPFALFHPAAAVSAIQMEVLRQAAPPKFLLD